jgi:tRNA (guanine-N7-)-methyltransferase
LSTTKDENELQWYGRRHGKKLRPTRQKLVDELLPKLRLDPNSGSFPANLTGLFESECKDVWLEIGFGAGEHLAGQAARNPDKGIIGCEPFINGVASLLTHIKAENLNNVRIYDNDARVLMDVLPEQSFERIFVLFADPWPKTRHHRRRIMVEANLDRFARLLKDAGELRFASDHKEYVSWALERLLHHPDFNWQAESVKDWRDPPSDWVETRYEGKARAKGDYPTYLRFTRLSRT